MSTLVDIFEEDSDTAETTEESEFGSPPESPVKTDQEGVVMAVDLERAVKNYESLQARFITLQSTVVGWSKDTVSESELTLFKSRLNQYSLEFDENYKEVYSLCADAAEFAPHQKVLDVNRVAMDKCMMAIMDTIEYRKKKSRTSSSSGSGSSSSGSGSGHGHGGFRPPTLEIPVFEGNVDGWISFRDLFLASLKDHVSMSDVQKLQYLLTKVKGEALNLIKGFPITDANFKEAWDLLEGRYDNKRDLLFLWLRKFFHQSVVSKECPKAIKSLISTSLECVRILSVLGQDVDIMSDILVFILMEKMDPETKREWTKTLVSSAVPKFQEVIQFLENHVRGLIAAGGKMSSSSGTVKSNHVSNFSKPKKPCVMCSESHALWKCAKFKALSTDDREQLVKSKGVCFLCLNSDHRSKDCKLKFTCRVCNGPHNTYLHKNQDSSSSTSDVSVHSSFTAGMRPVSAVLLSTAMVKVKDSLGGFKVCRVLLDPGSESSFVTQKCVKLLGLKPSSCEVQITGISSVSVGKAKGVLCLNLASLVKDFDFDVNCLVYSKVTGRLPSFNYGGEPWDFLRGLQLADPKYLEPREVDILLGADVTGFLTLPRRVMKDRFSPVALETELGWIISGPVQQSGLVPGSSNNYSVRVHHSKLELNEVVQKFWELEQVPEHPQWTAEERLCEKHFEIAHYREQGGRYGNPLPFNSKISGLGLSRFMALRRLEQVEKRLSRSIYREQYLDFMREYEKLGHMEKIPEEECGEVIGKTNYLPHHFVLREESTTTKFRVVFDGSAKTSTGLSLNDCLLVGPKIQDDLFHHLLRFRMHAVALKADIVKMFRQFVVPKIDSDFQRILWRESPEDKVREYRLKTVSYGTASGCHSAARCMRQLSLDYLAEHPVAAKAVDQNFYVDDLMTSLPSADQAVELQKDLKILAEKACLKISKWDSNESSVIEHVPLDSRAKNTNFKVDDDKFVSKALGVSWDSVNDFLVFEGFTFRNVDRTTKRVVLSEMSRIFDPLGLLAPVTVKIKIFFQKLWAPIQLVDEKTQVLGWDDEIPERYLTEWNAYQKGMSKIREIKLPRVLIASGTERMELHGFSDASELAYSAVLYLRCFGRDGTVRSTIMCAKTKVAPLKTQSIPKLELCGALLLARLVTSVVSGMSIDCPIYVWSDSELALKWIAGSSRRLKTFVANRVAEIQELIPNESWRFIPGEINPADCASRGLNGDELYDFGLWWNGPEFLSSPGLPLFIGKEIPPTLNMEQKVCLLTQQVRGAGVTPNTSVSQNVHIPETEKVTSKWLTRISTLVKLKRVFGQVLRFKHNCLAKSQDRVFGEFTVDELNKALAVVILAAQREDFGSEMLKLESGKPIGVSSRILSLNPFIDQVGVLRVGGRLQKSNEPSSTKHQIILDGRNPLALLLIRHGHSSLHHAGFQLLWASLQREYWILKARSSIRNLIRKCIMCRRLKAKVSQQLMGSLPSARVTPSRPFTHTGVDYAGPFSLSIAKGRGKRCMKGYLCLFICFSTKAVHLEYAFELTTESFIGALKRFVSRRGMPTDIYSDCGTNFVGAEKELHDLLRSANHNSSVSRFCVDKGIAWHFNSPAAPHHGGLWEAGVASTKFHLKRTVGTHTMTTEEFQTVLCLVEAALNSRPLCALSPDPAELEVLTPGHFLIGEPLTAIPEPDLQHIPINRLSRWQRTQQVFQHFWSRWSKEYVHTLQQRNKWTHALENIKVGDLVLLKEENTPPLKWRMGRVTEVYPGTDKLVRIVKLRTQNGELKRPVVKLCPLLPKEEV